MSVKVFDLLTATPASVSGKPTPTRTFQWLRNGTAISGANAQTYTLQPADEGALVAVRQIETNLLGKATATSATVGPVEEFIGIKASGGIETVINPEPGEFYRVHTFLESGDLTVTQGGEVEYLVVGAGGGGAAGGNTPAGGGGGAGGLLKYVLNESGNTDHLPLSLASGTYGATVGQPDTTPRTSNSPGLSGGNSAFHTLIAFGGGGGGATDNAGQSGGSGGGAGSRTSGAGTDESLGGESVSGQGHKGGDRLINGSFGGAGGGGAGGAGTDIAINSTVGFSGGVGKESEITGQVAVYAKGGDGGTQSQGGADAAPNTGNGGNGSGDNDTRNGFGGSGIVIVRYPISEAEYNAEAA